MGCSADRARVTGRKAGWNADLCLTLPEVSLSGACSQEGWRLCPMASTSAQPPLLLVRALSQTHLGTVFVDLPIHTGHHPALGVAVLHMQ